MNLLREVKKIGITVGVILIAIGILLAFRPVQVQLLLNTLAGVLFLVLGISGLMRAWSLRSKGLSRANGLIMISLISAIFGALVLLNPDITLFMVGMFVAIIAIATGFENIVTGLSIRKKNENGAGLIMFGIVHLIFGLFMAWNTFETLLLVVMIIGVYMIVYGVSLIASINMKIPKQVRLEKVVKDTERFDYDYDVSDYESTDEDIK